MFYVYVLQSVFDGSTYIGCTSDLKKRFAEHNAGKTRSIRSKRPLRLVYYESYISRRLARTRELSLKKNSSLKEDLFKRIFEAPSSNG